MAYILIKENGSNFSTTSYYEYVQEKKRLKAEAINYTEKLTGDEKRAKESFDAQRRWEYLHGHKLSESHKESIRNFLKVCDKVEEIYNKKGK